MKKIALIALFSTILLTSTVLADVVQDAQNDYLSKNSLGIEQLKRLGDLYTTYYGTDISLDQLAYFKSQVDVYIKLNKDIVDSGIKLDKYLEGILGEPSTITPNVVALIKSIETTKNDMPGRDELALNMYQSLENQYNEKKRQNENNETIKRLYKEIEQKLQPNEIFQDIILGKLDETKTIKADEYLIYSFIGTQNEKAKISFEVISGGPIDVTLMDSGEFIKFQSSMQGKNVNFRRWPVANNVKSTTYTFTFPNTDRYYILIDNTVYEDAKPIGSVDVNVKITKEQIFNVPGFEVIYSIVLFTMVFHFLIIN